MIKLEKISEMNQITGHASREAIIEGDNVVTWGGLEEKVHRYASFFAGKPYRRVVFLSENRTELILMASALSTLNISFIGIDYTSSLDQKHHCARIAGADAIVFSGTFESDAAWILKHLPMDSYCLEKSSKFLPRYRSTLRLGEPRQFESISFTSGTTGHPKGVLRTRSFDARRFSDLIRMFGFGPDQTFLATIPFFHASVVGWARLFLSLGGKLVISRVDAPEVMARDLVDRRVTTMLATPVVIDSLMSEMLHRDRFTDLGFIIVGGKHFPRDLKQRAVQVFGPIIHEYYGTTETGLNAIATPADLLARPESSGRLMDGNSAVILDHERRPLPEGQIGRIAIHSYQNMDGYLGGVVADTVAIGGDTFIVTADSGYLDGGQICVVNRAFGATTSLDLYALEDDLRQVSGVNDVFAVGGSRRHINIFIAVAKADQTGNIEAKLAMLATRLGGIEPKAIFVDRIPYNPSGKVRISELVQGA